MHVYYCDHFELPLPEGHRFPVEKYALARRLTRDRLNEDVRFLAGAAVTREELSRVHSSEYLDKVFEGRLSRLEEKRIGLPWSEKMLERCRRSTGATLAASKEALASGAAAHLSGGTHHAFRDEGQGFCVFNDVAVASLDLLEAGRVENVLVVDLDVHQGNGTADIFRDDERVFTFSMHGDRNYPFRKMAGDLDIGLPDGLGDKGYLSLLLDALEHSVPQKPDAVFYIAGADPYEGDRMGRVKLTKEGLAERDRVVLEFCFARNCPVTVVMGGGYGPVVDVAEIHANTIEMAYNHWLCIQRKSAGPSWSEVR
ncbi:MAG: histone deacetylase [Pirellulaceae bacterium]